MLTCLPCAHCEDDEDQKDLIVTRRNLEWQSSSEQHFAVLQQDFPNRRSTSLNAVDLSRHQTNPYAQPPYDPSRKLSNLLTGSQSDPQPHPHQIPSTTMDLSSSSSGPTLSPEDLQRLTPQDQRGLGEFLQNENQKTQVQAGTFTLPIEPLYLSVADEFGE